MEKQWATSLRFTKLCRSDRSMSPPPLPWWSTWEPSGTKLIHCIIITNINGVRTYVVLKQAISSLEMHHHPFISLTPQLWSGFSLFHGERRGPSRRHAQQPSSLPGRHTIHYSDAGRLLAAPQPILLFMVVLNLCKEKQLCWLTLYIIDWMNQWILSQSSRWPFLLLTTKHTSKSCMRSI